MAIASLTAMLLLSCNSIENSSSAEDLNFSQTPTLKRGSASVPLNQLQALPGAVTQASPNPGGQITIDGNGMYTAFYCGSMTISNLPFGREGCSTTAICDFTSIRKDATNTSYQFTGSGPSGQGTFSPYFVEIECGEWWGDFTPLSYANIYTTAFAGTPASVKCYLTLCGKCVGTATGGGPCSFSISSIKGVQEYTYP